MRSDFVGKCLERDYSGLAQQVQAHMVSVLPMQPAELRDAICQPASGRWADGGGRPGDGNVG
jgi:hypothetical protein